MISFIVTTYNDSEYLPKALNSILQQECEKEIIVIDDCSEKPLCDEANKLIKGLQHKVILRYYKNTVN